MIFILSSCNSTRRLSDDEVFLRKNKIEFPEGDQPSSLPSEDLKNVIKQKENRKILFFRFNMAMYNMVNPKRRARSHEKKVERVNRKIAKTQLKAHQATKEKKKKRLEKKSKKLKTEEVRTLRDWLAETVGEKPVVLDTILVDKTASQLSVFMSKKGYFDNRVESEIIYNKRNKRKAKVIYNLYPDESHHIKSIVYEIQDPEIKLEETSIININNTKVGDRFDVDVMNETREDITSYLNNRGYFSFVKDYIRFEADSTVGDHLVDLYLKVNSPTKLVNDSLIVYPHKKFYIGDITIKTEEDIFESNKTYQDTIILNDLIILYDEILHIRPKLIDYNVGFSKGQIYQKSRIEKTYRRFSDLGIYDAVSIQFVSKEIQGIPVLDCTISLTPAKVQSIALEGTGTHRDGSLGIFGSAVYRHKNMFNGAESGELKLISGFEAQQSLTSSELNEDINVSNRLALNTFEIGPEASIYLHNLFPYPKSKLTRSNDPYTKITAAYNFQSRPDYVRTISQFVYSGSFIENQEKGSSFRYDLFNLSLVNIDKTAEFQQFLDDLDNQSLTASYNNHLISSARFTWFKNTQKGVNQRSYSYYKPSIEASGILIRAFHDIIGKEKNETGAYEILDIVYSNYLKTEHDFRTYWQSNIKNRYVFRTYVGLGYPLVNLGVLPFEKSFFAGGSNGIRGWQARSLGPGSFRDTTSLLTFNKLGDIKLELNLEYRFKMTNMFEGAIFLDVGNIWLLNEDPQFPGSGFEYNQFISEMAVGSGIGFRLDFEYFLVRFDFGIQLKDPSKIKGERWFWEPKDDYDEFARPFYPEGEYVNFFPNINFNLGIGYPF